MSSTVAEGGSGLHWTVEELSPQATYTHIEVAVRGRTRRRGALCVVDIVSG
jgi:hypothetical protein